MNNKKNSRKDSVGALPLYQSNATPEERKRGRAIMRRQVESIMESPVVTGFRLDCGGCGTRVAMWMMYRCVYCGVYFCKSCAQVHFGKRVPKYMGSDE